jgi:hypothetical protein
VTTAAKPVTTSNSSSSKCDDDDNDDDDKGDKKSKAALSPSTQKRIRCVSETYSLVACLLGAFYAHSNAPNAAAAARGVNQWELQHTMPDVDLRGGLARDVIRAQLFMRCHLPLDMFRDKRPLTWTWSLLIECLCGH